MRKDSRLTTCPNCHSSNRRVGDMDFTQKGYAVWDRGAALCKVCKKVIITR